MAVLLDTSVIIDLLRGSDAAHAYCRQLEKQAAVSVITIAEISVGVRRRQEEDAANLLWSLMRVHDVDSSIAARAGQFVRHYGASHSVELADALIAATAEHHGLALATHNIKHFPKFARLKVPY